jgi:hypothetical protein
MALLMLLPVILLYTSFLTHVTFSHTCVTGLGDPEELAAALRRDIEAATECTASAGQLEAK